MAFWHRDRPIDEPERVRANADATADLVATYTAAKAFLIGEWIGAALCVVSFWQLYYGVFSHAYSPRTAVAAGLIILALGGLVFFRSRMYYRRIDFRWGRRWEMVAHFVAGSGAFFWFLFALVAVLTQLGVNVLPK